MENTEITSKLLDKIKLLYQNCEQIEFLENVESGFLSCNFILVNSGTKFFLKQYRFDDGQKIQEIHRVKDFLSQGNVPVISPLRIINGASFFEHDKKHYALFPFVEGKIFASDNLPQEAVENAGRFLAKIHLLSKNGYPEIIETKTKGWSREKFLYDANEIKRKIESIDKKNIFDQLALETIQLKSRLVLENTMSFEDFALPSDHIIHGDYHFQNIFFNEKNDVKHIFDLEKTELAPRVLEVVRSMNLMCFGGQYKEGNFESAKNYLAAYNNIYPIEKDELVRGMKVYFLKKAHSLWVEKERYLNGSNRVDCFLNEEFEFLKYYSENMMRFVEMLFFDHNC